MGPATTIFCYRLLSRYLNVETATRCTRVKRQKNFAMRLYASTLESYQQQATIRQPLNMKEAFDEVERDNRSTRGQGAVS